MPAVLYRSRRRSRGRVQGMCTPPPWDDEFFFVIALKICLPQAHRSVTSLLRGAPPPKKNPGSAGGFLAGKIAEISAVLPTKLNSLRFSPRSRWNLVKNLGLDQLALFLVAQLDCLGFVLSCCTFKYHLADNLFILWRDVRSCWPLMQLIYSINLFVWQEVKTIIKDNGFLVIQSKVTTFRREEAEKFYEEHRGIY